MHLKYQGVEIGCTRDAALFIRDYDPPTADQDVSLWPVVGGDGEHLGHNRLRGAAWQFLLGTNADSTQDVLDKSARLETAWKDAASRAEAAPLEYSTDHGATWHLIYGTPTKYTPPKAGYLASRGYADMAVEFRQLDPRHYTAVESSTTIRTSPAASGGLVAPVVPPIQASRTGGVSERLAVNAGTVPTPVRARFHGPIKNPSLSLDGGWAYHLSTSLAWDEWLEVDALARTVTRGYDGQAVGVPARGAVSVASAPFRDLVLKPGSNSLRLSGVDPVGTSYVEVFWRNASMSMR